MFGVDGSTGFSVDIEDSNHVVLTKTNSTCDGDCIDLQAVTQGGNPPFTYKWSDGSTGATKHVCPKSSSSLSVSVTDSPTTGELASSAQTVTAQLAITCSDAGSAPVDAGVCAQNLSFEGTAMPNIDTNTNPDIGAPPWVGCNPMPGLAVNAGVIESNWISVAHGMYPAATDGMSYLALDGFGPDYVVYGVNTDATSGRAWAPLCQPLHANTQYSMLIDLATAVNLGGIYSVSLNILGGTSSCTQGEVLWSSPIVGPTFKTYCATFTPTQEMTFLGLQAHIAAADAGAMSGSVLVDHIVPVAKCP
jgi:hypothetical protein